MVVLYIINISLKDRNFFFSFNEMDNQHREFNNSDRISTKTKKSFCKILLL